MLGYGKMILSEFAWYKQHGPLFRVWLLEGFVLMACTEENDVIFSLQTKRVIYLMKIQFQLIWKLHKWNLILATTQE